MLIGWSTKPGVGTYESSFSQRFSTFLILITYCCTPEKFQQCDGSQRLLIAISGVPGSGKTTLAACVAHGINKLYHQDYHTKFPNSPPTSSSRTDPSQPDVAFVVPLDGYHLTRKQLSEMPNAEEAVFRRGAAFTFDAQSYLKLVMKVRRPISPETTTIFAPSFDHAVKDPVSNDIPIPVTARIVIFEGLYTALDEDGWREAHELMDEVWFVDTDIERATQRVAKRNFAAGISASFEESLARTKESDMRNARHVLDSRLEVHEVIPSIEDESWVSQDLINVQNELERKDTEDDDYDVDEDTFRKQRMMRMDSIAALAADGVGM
jgi:pantothenate kinase